MLTDFLIIITVIGMSNLARDSIRVSGIEVQKPIGISDPEVDKSHDVSGIELTQINVEENIPQERGACWSYNVSVQFPVRASKTKNGSDEVEVKQPHEGYFIKTTMKDSKMNGKSSIYSDKGVLIATLRFENGIATGPCTLYDTDGLLFFEGYFENGYRTGRGQEYDRQGNMIYDGFFKKGQRLNISSFAEKKGFWKEMDENNNLIRICQLDSTGRCDGICYSYYAGKIDKVSRYKEGNEIEVMKQFVNNKMVEYENGVKRYEGDYMDSVEHNYPRHGIGEEFESNGKVRSFKGNYKNGKRYGKGISYKHGKASKERKWVKGHSKSAFCIYPVLSIIGLILLITSLIFDLFVGTAILLIVLVIHILRWSFISCCSVKKCSSATLDWISDLSNDMVSSINGNEKTCKAKTKRNCGAILSNIYLSMTILFVVTLIVIVTCTVLYSMFVNPYVSIVQTTYKVKSNNYNKVKRFELTNKPFLRTIEIEENSFRSVQTFKIDGLTSLTSLSIGFNSFTSMKNGFGNDSSKSFHILNCAKLESISIGEYSFSDYGGEFELSNLPQLQSIVIGNINSNSYNFYSTPFDINSMIYINDLYNRFTLIDIIINW